MSAKKVRFSETHIVHEIPNNRYERFARKSIKTNFKTGKKICVKVINRQECCYKINEYKHSIFKNKSYRK